MVQTNSLNEQQVCDNGENTLDASLLPTATATTTVSENSRRYWRVTRYVGILISIKKPAYDQEYPQPSPSSIPYASCPQEPSPTADSEQSQHVIDIPSDNGEKTDSDRAKVIQIVKEKNLNSLREFGGVDQVARLLGSNLEAGINGSLDHQAWKTGDHPAEARGFLYFFLNACNRLTIFLLLLSAALSFAIDMIQKGAKGGWHDGVAILSAVVGLVGFTSLANFIHERKSVKKLLEKMRKLEVKVIRCGKDELIAIYDVVEGDIVILEKDDRVPADGLFVEGEELEVDEVMNSKIDPYSNPFLFSGSKVVKGYGRMLVTSTGDNTAMGKSLILVAHDPQEERLLQSRIEEPNCFGEGFALCVTVLILVVVLIRLLQRIHDNSKDLPEAGNVSHQMLMKIVKTISEKSQRKIWILTSALVAMVIGIRNGMPVVITLSLGQWDKKVKLCKAEPRNPYACATMGLVTVLCLDVTDRPTCNRVEIHKFCVDGKDITESVDPEIDQVVLEALRQGIGASVLVPEIALSSTIHSIISWSESNLVLDMEDFGKNFDILGYKKLSSGKKVSGVLMRKKGNDEYLHLHWSGAASTILKMCTHYYNNRGEIHGMADEKKGMFEHVIKTMEDAGLIAVAFAYGQIENQELTEGGLNLLALVGLKCTCENEIKSEVEALRGAGVQVKLFSGNELSAASALGCELEVLTPCSSDEALEAKEFLDFIGNCLPEDKFRVVQLLRQEGHVVAFFGGLTTGDTLALKEADVGITHEYRSTEMARGNSDIFVTDFGSLFDILKCGRCAYHNIQKFIQIQLTTCISGMVIALVATIVTGASPITGAALLWLNLVTSFLGLPATLMELKGNELLKNKPAERSQSLLTKVMWRNIAVQVLYQSSVLLFLHFRDRHDDVRKTMIFNMFYLCQIFNQFNAMDVVNREDLKIVLHSYSFLLTMVAMMALQLIVIELLWIVTNFVRLNAVQWAFCFLVAALSWGFDVALKYLADILTKIRLFIKSVDSHGGFVDFRFRIKPLAWFALRTGMNTVLRRLAVEAPQPAPQTTADTSTTILISDNPESSMASTARAAAADVSSEITDAHSRRKKKVEDEHVEVPDCSSTNNLYSHKDQHNVGPSFALEEAAAYEADPAACHASGSTGWPHEDMQPDSPADQ